MEEFMTRLEMAKGFLFEILKDAGLSQFYSDNIVESYFFDPFNNTSNAYRTALAIFDILVIN